MTDPSGKFAIDGLGEGPHDLIISLSDVGIYRRNIDVGNETGQIAAVLTTLVTSDGGGRTRAYTPQ